MSVEKIKDMESRLAKAAGVCIESVKLHFFNESDDIFLIHREAFEPTSEYNMIQADISTELEEYGKFVTAVLNGPEVCNEQFEIVFREK